MSAGSGGGGGDARRPSTCRVELGALLAPEPRPLDNKVKVCVPLPAAASSHRSSGPEFYTYLLFLTFS